jgi:protein-S-isoprenylcysteine O-methyltransferase Ste14
LWLAKPTVTSILLSTIWIVSGIVLRAWASGHLQKNEKLATTGPYAYTRNPLYLGSVILALGFTIAARSPWVGLGLLLLFLGIYLPVIRDEEAFLRERFPEFADYAGRVPRFLPGLRATASGSGEFSWDLYWKHREYNAALGSVAMLIALLAKRFWILQ